MRLAAITTNLNNLCTVNIEDTLYEALVKMRTADIKSLPVLNNKKFAGVIFKDTILEQNVFEKKDLNANFVRDFMYKDIPVLDENLDLDDASSALKEYKTPFVAIKNSKDEMVGIITHSTVFNELTEIFGVSKGDKINIYISDVPGQIGKIGSIVKKHKGNIIGLALRNPKTRMQVKEVIIRVDCKDIEALKSALKTKGYKID